MCQYIAFTRCTALDEAARIVPEITPKFGKLGARQQIALQPIDAAGEAGLGLQPIDEGEQHAVELTTERMRWILAYIVEEGRGRRDDALQQERIGAIEFEQRRQLVANLVLDDSQRVRLGQRAMHGAEQVIEQALMATIPDEAAHGAGSDGREINRLQLGHHAARDKGFETRRFRRRHRLRQQPQQETREIRATLFIAQPVCNETRKIHLT